MVLNRQNEIPVDLGEIRLFVRRLRAGLRLGRRDFNVCFVNDCEIARLNAAYRGKARPTDVLSFPFREFETRNSKLEIRNSKLEYRNLRCEIGNFKSNAEFRDFLGDIVIAAPTARRNARAEGHALIREIRWLILHGVLHLLGYDHETDDGEMAALEYELRGRLRT